MLLTSCDPTPQPLTPVTSATAPPPTSASAVASVTEPAKPAPGSFEDDLAFLEQHGQVIVLESPSGGRVALSAKYQGRVMTSAVGKGDKSLGFVHKKFIDEGKTGTQFDNYGGEDRFWLGPEGGQFGLYFKAGKPFTFAEWQAPEGFQTGEWTVKEKAPDHVVFTHAMKIVNYAGTTFDMDVERTVKLLDAKDASTRLGVTPDASLKWVAFETTNKITNTGKNAWTKKDGLPSVWILAMYNPSPDTFVTIPFDAAAKGEIVNDRYFGKVPADRLQVDEKQGFLLFACDGHQRGKIGVGPARAKEFLGSYSASWKLLTVVNYDKPAGAKDYVNSMWEKQKEPFGGDVVNSYNDGPTEPGKPSLGGFYEIETSSPGAALAPGASLVHTHRTFHFVGEPAALDPIATKTLGIPTARIAQGTK
jgi:hypothetical protein